MLEHRRRPVGHHLLLGCPNRRGAVQSVLLAAGPESSTLARTSLGRASPRLRARSVVAGQPGARPQRLASPRSSAGRLQPAARLLRSRRSRRWARHRSTTAPVGPSRRATKIRKKSSIQAGTASIALANRAAASATAGYANPGFAHRAAAAAAARRGVAALHPLRGRDRRVLLPHRRRRRARARLRRRVGGGRGGGPPTRRPCRRRRPSSRRRRRSPASSRWRRPRWPT